MKDRSMAVAPYPVRALRRAVILQGSWVGGRAGGYQTRVAGHHGVIVMSDGAEVYCCSRPHGHRSQETFVACTTRRVSELNDAAGIPEDVR